MPCARAVSPAVRPPAPLPASPQKATATRGQPPARSAQDQSRTNGTRRSGPPARWPPWPRAKSCRLPQQHTRSSIPMTRRFLHNAPWSSLLDAWIEAYPSDSVTPSCEGRPPAFQASRAQRAINSAVASAACLEGRPGPVTPSTKLSRFAPRQRGIDQRAIGALRQRGRTVEPEPRQGLAVGGIRWLRHPLPQQSRQFQRRALRLLQQLQGRDQPLLDVGKIAAERERRQQTGLARRLQRR